VDTVLSEEVLICSCHSESSVNSSFVLCTIVYSTVEREKKKVEVF
jgi:hypothetical protein